MKDSVNELYWEEKFVKSNIAVLVMMETKKNDIQLFTNGIHPSMTNLELRDLFQQFGQLDDANTFTARNKKTNRPRGWFGYIAFTGPGIAKSVAIRRKME